MPDPLLLARMAGIAAIVFCCFLAVLPSRADEFPAFDKLPSHPELPDPLVTLAGKKITTREEWDRTRAPELRGLFQHYMYGVLPPAPKVQAKVERLDPKALNGKATLKEVRLTFPGTKAPALHLLLVVPNRRSGPAPVFVGLNFRGNHTVLSDPKIRLPESWLPDAPGVKDHRATDAGHGSESQVWNIEETIDHGYAVAVVYYGDIVPDDPARRGEGVQPHFGPGGEKPGAHDWGAVAAWAWGLQRVIDYLVTDGDIDASRIVLVGHSRLGKATLLAGAFDPRVAVIIPHQAGMGGTAPSRGKTGESVKAINTRFPHWFCKAFHEFNDHPDRLPMDQNCLVALCAPRPVLFSNAVEDTWANPAGQFEVLRAADPVYRLHGVKGLEAERMPALGGLVSSRLGFYLRAGTHSMTREDWRAFREFADKHLPR